MRLTASVVTYKTPPVELLQCVEALAADGVEAIYIVDNSPDDTIRGLVAGREKVEYTHLPSNQGYGAAHNVAIRRAFAAGTEYHLVVNSDISFEAGTLVAIADEMDRRQEVGLLQPRIIYPDGKEQYSSRLVPAPLDLIEKRFMPRFLVARRLRRYMLTDRPAGVELNIPYHQGSFMFFRASALRETGLFDERFFMYPEDIDISRRVHERYVTLYWPARTIVHCHRASSATNLRMLWIHITNMIRYFNKWGWIFDSRRREFNRRCLAEIAKARK